MEDDVRVNDDITHDKTASQHEHIDDVGNASDPAGTRSYFAS